MIANAKGLAILKVARVGFLLTVRAGSGIIISKLRDNRL